MFSKAIHLEIPLYSPLGSAAECAAAKTKAELPSGKHSTTDVLILISFMILSSGLFILIRSQMINSYHGLKTCSFLTVPTNKVLDFRLNGCAFYI